MALRSGSLFAGIGGFDLGFRRAGIRTAWMVEQHPYRRAVLERRFQGVPVHRDVRAVDYRAVEPVEVVTGGFPCTDLSLAGRGDGITGRHSGLWREFARAIRVLRPRWVVVENVSALTRRGLGAVLADLAALGYDAEWDCVPAAAVGAPHYRDRIWIVAYPNGAEIRDDAERLQPDAAIGWHAEPGDDGQAGDAADAEVSPLRRGLRAVAPPRIGWRRFADEDQSHGAWSSLAGVRGVDDGIPARLDRLAALGDSLVPQIAEELGHQIVSYEKETAT